MEECVPFKREVEGSIPSYPFLQTNNNNNNNKEKGMIRKYCALLVC